MSPAQPATAPHPAPWSSREASLGATANASPAIRLGVLGVLAAVAVAVFGCARPAAEVEPDGAFTAALASGDRGALERLVARDAVPANALRRAVDRRCDGVALLLEAGVEARGIDGAGALAHSLARARPHCARLLREAGARLEAWGRPGRHLLTAAVLRRDEEQIERLIEIGFPIDAADRHGENALLLAAKAGNRGLVGGLLDRGADPDATDRDGWTALAHAARSGNAAIATTLLSAGARADGRSALGWSALQLAAQAGHTEVALLVLAAGAAADEWSPAAETALIWAARGGDRRLVQALLAAGADAGRERDGVTAAYWARAAGHADVAADLDHAAVGAGG